MNKDLNKIKYTPEYFQKRSGLPGYLAYPLIQFLKKEGVETVLEVGCGSGQLLKFLKKNGFQVTGVDQSPIAVKLSGAIKAKATKLPFEKNTFDAVLGISLIEHLTLKEGKQFLKEAYRVLKRNGVIFLVTPNAWSPAKIFLGKKWFAYQDFTHKYFYSPYSLAKLCGNIGFSRINFSFRIPPKTPFDWPIPTIFLHLPSFLKRFLNFLLISSALSLFRDSFWLSAKK